MDKLSKKEAKFDGFKIEIKLSDLHTVIESEFWPNDICVRMYYKPRNDRD